MKKIMKSVMRNLLTMIILLSLSLTTACGAKTEEAVIKSADDLAKVSVKNIEQASVLSSILKEASEKARFQFEMATQKIQLAFTIRCTRIPIIFNADRQWLDQRGEVMANEDVESFFENNHELASEILWLNKNIRYATKLYSVKRQKTLDEYVIKHDPYDENEVDNSVLRGVYTEVLRNTNIDEATLCVLREHFPNNGACSDVDKVKSDLATTRNGSKVSCSKNGDLIDRIYFTCLADFTTAGKICIDNGIETPIIPILLSNDGTWYDCNLNPVDEVAVANFIEEYPDQAGYIIELNFDSNPFLDTSKLEPNLRSELAQTSVLAHNNNSRYNICLSTLNEAAIELPSRKAFADLRGIIQHEDDNENDIFYPVQTFYENHLVELVSELEKKSSDRREAMQTYGFYGISSDSEGYLFVITLARALESGTF